MSANKIRAISAYLSERFPNAEIDEKADFDRGAQSFKVHLPSRTLLLKVSNEFIEDNHAPEILHRFNLLSLAEVLGKDASVGILVSQRGLETFARN